MRTCISPYTFGVSGQPKVRLRNKDDLLPRRL